jgi:23S rRNA (guanosine2251-2'-O)-methyltransferase
MKDRNQNRNSSSKKFKSFKSGLADKSGFKAGTSIKTADEVTENQENNKILGIKLVEEYLDSGHSINKIWMLTSAASKFKDLELRARKLKIPVFKLKREELQTIAGTDKHRSVVAEIAAVPLHDVSYILDNKLKKVLFAVNIEDPHNLGAITRTAKAFGVEAVMFSNRKASAITETVIKSSAGAVLSLPMVRVGNAVSSLEKLKKANYWVYGTDVKSENTSAVRGTEFAEQSILVMGNEGSGLNDNIKKHCDFMLHIPCAYNSLNVSVATGIVLSEVYLQQN